jgi:O-antigen/teichoic acid export membrane protein
MTEENLKSTILIAYFLYALGLVCQLGFNILIFRQFSLEEVGTYGLITALAVFAGVVMDLGISQTLIRGFSQNTLGFSQAVAGALALRIPILIVGLGALATWVHLKSSLGAMETALLALAITTQFLIGLRTIATSWLRARERQKVANIVDFLGPLGYLSIGLFLVYLQKLNLPLFFLGILLLEGAISYIAFAILHQVHLPARARKNLSFAYIKGAVALLWKPSLILGTVSFLYIVEHRLDWLLVYAYASGREMAYYCLATKVYEIFVSAVFIVIQTMFPWMCKAALTRDKDPRTIIAFKSIAGCGMLLAVALALYLPNFLTLFWGTKFAESNHLILWLMCGACLEPINDIMLYNLISKGNERYLLVASTVPALVQFIINIILIPIYGSLGATSGIIIMIVSSFLLLSFFSVKNNLFKIDLLIKIFIIFIIMALILSCRVYINYTPCNNPIIIIALLILLLSLLLSKSEWSLIRSDLAAALTTFKN